jgi:anti-sigma factor RsiW
MGESHPDLNALAAFIDQRLSEAERTAVIAHLAGCFDCRAVVAAHARGVGSTPVQADQPAGRGSRRGFRPAVWLPIAATLTLATTAGLLVWRIDRGSPPPAGRVPIVSEPARPATTTPVPVVPEAQSPVQLPPPAPTATVPPGRPDPLATRRNAVRVVNGKTFRLVAGDWIDAAYDPPALLPLQEFVGPDARTEVLTRIPALAPYAALGANVTVVHEGVVYRFRR